MSGLSDLSVGASPYPGLRPFRSDEADIFFGREEGSSTANRGLRTIAR